MALLGELLLGWERHWAYAGLRALSWNISSCCLCLSLLSPPLPSRSGNQPLMERLPAQGRRGDPVVQPSPPAGGEHSLEETPGLAFVPSIPLRSLFDIMLDSHRVEIFTSVQRDGHLSSSPLERVAHSLTISPGCRAMDPRRRAGGLVFGSGWEQLGQGVTEGSQSLQHAWGQVEMCQSRALPLCCLRAGGAGSIRKPLCA